MTGTLYHVAAVFAHTTTGRHVVQMVRAAKSRETASGEWDLSAVRVVAIAPGRVIPAAVALNASLLALGTWEDGVTAMLNPCVSQLSNHPCT